MQHDVHQGDESADSRLLSAEQCDNVAKPSDDLAKSNLGPPEAPRNISAGGAANWNMAFARSDWLRGLFLVFIVIVAYLPVWKAGFIMDDDHFLFENPLIKSTDGLYQFWFSTEAPDYFPMTSTTLWLEWRLWGGHPLGYHLVNVLLHALSAMLWWRVLSRLKIPGAWLAAAVFAVHPVNVDSVAWITERKNTLAMVFCVLTLLFYLRFEDTGRRRWHGLALISFTLALLSKTAVAPLPLVLLGLAWWRRGRVERKDMWRSVPFFAAAAFLALVTIWFQYNRAIGTDVVRVENFWSRLAGAGWAVWFYLYKVFLPVNLSFVYPRWRIDGANALSYMPGLLLIVGLLVCWRYRRGWGRAWLFMVGYFVVMLLPVLGFLNIYFMRYSLVADRWQYFSILGPIALAVGGVTTALVRFERESPVLKPVLGGVILLALGALTWRHSQLYANSETLWRATLAGNPGCFLACNDLGYLMLTRGQEDKAITYIQKALEINPDYAEAHVNLGSLFLQKGELDKAILHFQKAIEIQPDFAGAYYNFGNALLQKGRLDEAIIQFQKTLEIKPKFAAAHGNLGNAFLQKGQADEAMAHFQKALKIQPDFAEAHYNIGIVLLQRRQLDEAMIHFQRAVEIQPDYADAHYNLGIVLLRRRQLDEAMIHFQKAVEIRPDDAEADNNIGWILLQKGRLDEAIARCQHAVKIRPGSALAHNNLATAFLGKGQAREAVTHYNISLEIQPDNVRILSKLAWVLATWPEASVRNGAAALQLAQRANRLFDGHDPLILRTLAAAYAETGQFTEAITSARQALQLATIQGNALLTNSLWIQLELYRAGSAFRDTNHAIVSAFPNQP